MTTIIAEIDLISWLRPALTILKFEKSGAYNWLLFLDITPSNLKTYKEIAVKTNPEVELVFNNYPESVGRKMVTLRELVIETANEIEGLKMLEETLKWGEPSYLTEYGSTLRMDWKSKSPNQYAMYFKCTSRLIETFKRIFKNIFQFEGKRAIVFQMEDDIPKDELKACIKTALTYHKVKHLPTLGL